MPAFSLPFYKVSPGGNPTLLVFTEGTGIHLKQHPHIAAKLMRPEHVGGEQVGFVTRLSEDAWRLDMMGGEFCGNACRALAATAHLQEGAPAEGTILCSGMESAITYKITLHDSGATDSRIDFPLATEQFRIREVENNMHIVDMPGISHVLLDEQSYPLTSDPLWSASILRKRYLLESQAVGVIWYAKIPYAEQDLFRIIPVVWVKNTNSTHAESACGSGTLALALFLQQLQNKDGKQPDKKTPESLIAVRQPSGAVFQSGLCENTQCAVISGPVNITAKGTAFIKL